MSKISMRINYWKVNDGKYRSVLSHNFVTVRDYLHLLTNNSGILRTCSSEVWLERSAHLKDERFFEIIIKGSFGKKRNKIWNRKPPIHPHKFCWYSPYVGVSPCIPSAEPWHYEKLFAGIIGRELPNCDNRGLSHGDVIAVLEITRNNIQLTCWGSNTPPLGFWMIEV